MTLRSLAAATASAVGALTHLLHDEVQHRKPNNFEKLRKKKYLVDLTDIAPTEGEAALRKSGKPRI